MVGVGVLLPREGARPFRTTDVQKVRLSEACERAGPPMDGIDAAIRAGGCRSRSWKGSPTRSGCWKPRLRPPPGLDASTTVA